MRITKGELGVVNSALATNGAKRSVVAPTVLDVWKRKVARPLVDVTADPTVLQVDPMRRWRATRSPARRGMTAIDTDTAEALRAAIEDALG